MRSAAHRPKVSVLTTRVGDRRNDIVKREQLPNSISHPALLSLASALQSFAAVVERSLNLDNVHLRSYHTPTNVRPTSLVANREGWDPCAPS